MSVGLSLNAQSELFSWLFGLLFCSIFFSITYDGVLNAPDFPFSIAFCWMFFCSAVLDAFKFSFLEVYNVTIF